MVKLPDNFIALEIYDADDRALPVSGEILRSNGRYCVDRGDGFDDLSDVDAERAEQALIDAYVDRFAGVESDEEVCRADYDRDQAIDDALSGDQLAAGWR